MPLPDIIEILPLTKPVQAEITIPGSKSITNRALILAALADGEMTLRGALWSEDTQVMVEALGKLGFEVKVEADPHEFCNRTITVKGQSGQIPKAGTESEPLEIFVGNAGTAARFLAALVCLGQGVYRLQGIPRMHERPQRALFVALRELGYRVESANEKLPVLIFGAGSKKGNCVVSIQESSQFASALLLCAHVGNWKVEIAGNNSEESPYVAMTTELIRRFPIGGGIFEIEPDASSGSYFWAADWIIRHCDGIRGELIRHLQHISNPAGISVSRWPTSGWQIDADFVKFLFVIQSVGSGSVGTLSNRVQVGLPVRISRQHDLGDSIMTAAILAPFQDQPVCLTDLARLRLQETERVVALRTELTKCGAKVTEKGDTLIIEPSVEALHGAEIETYNDHRMAMCFAVLGLRVPGIKIRNPACVKKTFPNFFQKLASMPPHGLGATILDAATGRKLGLEELFAD